MLALLCIFVLAAGHSLAVNVNEPGNPVKSYTLDNFNLNGQALTRIETLTAKITRTELRTGVRGNDITTPVRNHLDRLRVSTDPHLRAKNFNFHNGHVIAWALGGPSSQTYNFYPQISSYNTGAWSQSEKLLRQKLEGEPGSVATIDFVFEYNHLKWPGIPSKISFDLRIVGSNKTPLRYTNFDTQASPDAITGATERT